MWKSLLPISIFQFLINEWLSKNNQSLTEQGKCCPYVTKWTEVEEQVIVLYVLVVISCGLLPDHDIKQQSYNFNSPTISKCVTPSHLVGVGVGLVKRAVS